ncbi:MAG: pyruvate dehydrogenase complex dihydrolipoamide acetyltransferase [Holosporales bacterium]|nr:pyruvate dehydrogenase complex dihydrolipoamide acetyltransferase [Holosporales bacterium]
MPISILMPALSPTMTEGNLVKWHKKKGDIVKSGDVLAEIETDKATMEVEAVDEGVLGVILVPEGTDGVAVNQLIAIILEEGEGEEQLQAFLTSGQLKNPLLSQEVVLEEKAGKEEAGLEEKISQTASSSALSPLAGERQRVSPLARRIAAEKNVSLQNMKGSGPRGRIVKQDVLEALNSSSALLPSVSQKLSQGNASLTGAFSGYEPPFVEHKVSLMRQVIARRLTESKQTIPHFYLSLEANIDRLLEIRKDLNRKGDLKISVNDMVIQVLAKTLARFPEVNVAWAGETLRAFERVDLAVAVSVDGGLITPVIRGANQKGLQEISAEMKELASRARSGKLKPEEFQGGTFSLSNLGMFGIETFQAIINPPQAGILAVGAGLQKPIVENNQIKIATLVNLTLSLDHRAVDGALGAVFLSEVKASLEQPGRVLL